MKGPVETEIKLRIPSADRGQALLDRHGFQQLRSRVFEVNLLYDTPEGLIRARGELLRLRRSGADTVLTFKGVSTPGKHKSRPETEVRADDFAALDSILRRLGYIVVFRYEKYRTEYRQRVEEGIATLDETPIGTFLELEGDPLWIDAASRNLGFSGSDYITDSYARLFQDFCNATGDVATNMVFQPASGDCPQFLQEE